MASGPIVGQTKTPIPRAVGTGVQWSFGLEAMTRLTLKTFEGKPCRNCGGTTRRMSDQRCLHCRRARSRAFQARNYTKYGSYLYKRLGITSGQVYAMAEDQEWRCKICGVVPNTLLHVDHCHKTMKIRGLLCKRCNMGLGYFKDNPESLIAAAGYLRAC